jgi:hypothetical protein
MRLVVAMGGICDGEICAVPAGGAFTLSVKIIEGPAGGYVGAQSFIEFGADLRYEATTDATDEILWPDCETLFAIRSQLSSASVTHGCLTGLPGSQPISTYDGNLVDLAFTCSGAPSITLVKLLPLGDPFAATSGTKFVLSTGEAVQAKVTDLTVECVGLPTATPTPFIDPTSTPVAPPGPPSLVGDANCDGTANALDVALLLQLGAGLIPTLPCPNRGDANQDGNLNALDAALVLQFSAGLLTNLPP